MKWRTPAASARVASAAGVFCLARTVEVTTAIHLLEDGTEMPYNQELLGHGSIETTERYTRITECGKQEITSPLDNLRIQEEV